MNYTDYFVIDIETIPLDMEKYEGLNEEEKSKMINPIDSKIVALGIRYKGYNKVIMGEEENKILEEFWKEWNKIKTSDFVFVVGFNISNFDIPFITARSLINNVKIIPFSLKSVLDIREKINAYRYGATRGKLKEYAALMNLTLEDVDGSDVARLWKDKDFDTLKKYLIKDLEITDELFKRARDTRILEITKW